MPLYCYIVETGEYEDREAHILGHETHYSQEEFDNICIEVTKKYGDVEEVEYFSSYDTTDVKKINYEIDAYKLIVYLVAEYGFVELNIPRNDGYNYKEISRTPVPPEKLRKIEIKRPKCMVTPGIKPGVLKFEEDLLACYHVDSDFNIVNHPNNRCNPVLKRKGE